MHDSKTAYIGIGSNQGDKLRNCRNAVARMGRLPGCQVVSLSSFFSSEPVGVEGQDWYVNAVAVLQVEIEAGELLRALMAVEAGMGRVRRQKWEPRPIDLDILLYGAEVIDEADLKVPHPLMHTRRFVLAPLALLAPERTHPVLGRTIAELLEALPEDEQAVTLLVGD